MTRSLEAAEDP
jgi:ATP-binding cassette subfamily B (MDR/TAP) protein 1